MARPATGSIIEPKGTRKSWSLRFRANGERQFESLGTTAQGWNREKAEEALADRLAAVRLGVWKPPRQQPTVTASDPSGETFHEFAEQWFAARQASWKPASRTDVKWALEKHLLPVFGQMRITDITIESVDRFARAKQAEGRLGNNSINKCIQHMAAVLEEAVEWDRIQRNPAKGRKRRLPAEAPKRSHLEVEQLPTLLRVAHPNLRILIAVLAGCGLRIGEALALTWGDVNIAAGTIRVRDSKTAAGVRVVDIPSGAAQELRSRKARLLPRQTAPVFLNKGGGRQSVRNAEMALRTAVKRANRELEKIGIDPIDEKLTPHSLRRFFASLRFAAGEDVIYVVEQGGWTDPAFAIRVYARATRRRQRLTGAHLTEFDTATEWAALDTAMGAGMGTKDVATSPALRAIPDPKPATAPDSV
jgi:integrase